MPKKRYHSSEPEQKVAIIGYNSSFDLIFKELGGDVSEVIVADIPDEKREAVLKLASL